MRRYRYVGPDALRPPPSTVPAGAPIRARADLAPWLTSGTMTFVVGTDGVLRVADRRSEHVDCAGGGDVLAAGELTVMTTRDGPVVTEASNQSTGYCPEPESWVALSKALDTAAVPHPGRYTYEAIFRRCPACGERSLVKEAWFECVLCGAELPRTWNFDDG